MTEFISALSLDQPFAHLIFDRGMNVESRTWTTERRGTIAIHATAKRSRHEFDYVKSEFGIDYDFDDVEFSAVLGFARVVDVITEKTVTKKTSKWFIGPYGFVLEDIIRLPEPVPAKGNRKFWRLKGAPLKAALAQISKSELARLKPFVTPD